MDPSDEALVLACRRGDAAAWQALVARYQRLIYAIGHRGGLNAEQAADMFQQVFVTLFEHLPSIAQPAQIGAWLATTARRETWRLRRAQGPQSLVGNSDEDDDAPEVLDDAPLPEEVLLALEEEHIVRTVVSTLDERCRRLLTLLFYGADPPPYTEVARALGLREGSIGPIRARCLRKLLAGLQAAGF